eukprot:scaffold191950_cov17-Tisochrysis_lutea.AAC.1
MRRSCSQVLPWDQVVHGAQAFWACPWDKAITPEAVVLGLREYSCYQGILSLTDQGESKQAWLLLQQPPPCHACHRQSVLPQA